MNVEPRQMMGQGSGAIVNCSSIGGMRGLKGRAAYSARNSALSASRAPLRLIMPAGDSGSMRYARGQSATHQWRQGTKNNDPDIIKAFVAAEPIVGWASSRKSLLPYCGYVVRARASWSGTPWPSMAVFWPSNPILTVSCEAP